MFHYTILRKSQSWVSLSPLREVLRTGKLTSSQWWAITRFPNILIFTSKLKLYQRQQILSRIFPEATGWLTSLLFLKKSVQCPRLNKLVGVPSKNGVPRKIRLVQLTIWPAAKALFILSQYAAGCFRGPPSPEHRTGKTCGLKGQDGKQLKIFNA